MEIIRTVSELRNRVSRGREKGQTIGLVPTMGALHEGHISLVSRARKENDLVVVSTFVNPTQFNNKTDLVTYPRNEQADVEKLEKAGVDIAFIPSVEEVYPEPDTRVFDLGPVAQVMEGKMRPGHFNGVAQIVSKLFDFVNPDRAYFGEKDFQQIAVIKSMLHLTGQKVEIVPCPIKRHPDGLAMSSRNQLLDAEHRAMAPQIHKTLEESREKAKTLPVQELRSWVKESLEKTGNFQVEYYEIVDGDTMQPVDQLHPLPENAVGCITVHCGGVRLIDNIRY